MERKLPSRAPLTGKAEDLEVETGTITMFKGARSYVMVIQPPLSINDNARLERMRIQPVSRVATEEADIMKFDAARFGKYTDHRDLNFELYSGEVRELLGNYVLEAAMKNLPATAAADAVSKQ